MRQLYEIATQLHRQGDLDQAEGVYRRILQRLPDQSDTLNALGMLLHQTGRDDEAIDLIKRAIRNNRNAPFLHVNLGEILRNAGRLNEAIEHYRKALRIKPNDPGALLCLGNALHDQKKHEEAISYYKRAILINPTLAEAHGSLGVALQESGDLDSAAAALRQAIKLNPGFAEAHLNLGNTLLMQQDYQAALQHYQSCLELAPELPQAHLGLARVIMESEYPDFGMVKRHLDFALEHLLEDAVAVLTLGRFLIQQGNIIEAVDALARSIMIAPLPAALYEYAHAQKFKQPSVLLAGSAELLLRRSPPLGDDDLALVHYALGKMHDDLQQFEIAFSHYSQGAACIQRVLPYDEAAEAARFARITEFFTAECIERHRRAGNFGEGLVFVVGMPRSGTSLIEQVLSCHPSVYGAGELYNLTSLEENMTILLGATQPYPEALAAASPEKLQEIAQDYLDELHQRFPGSHTHLSDKAPHNFLRVGLIAMLFPGAHIIHCKRNPMDNCLSLFFQKFGTKHAYSYNLANLGRYYRLYEGLMAHWHGVLPGWIFDIQYEEIIANPEYWSRKLIEYVGLEWDDACLAPHKLERTVRTASHWQVRQPIYNTSVERWRHYEQHLEPLKGALKIDQK